MRSEYKLLLRIALIIMIGLFLSSCGKKDVWKGNILIITLDTTRADHIGSYGYRNGLTPNIDRLAENGVRFENCYSSIPLTLPSHANIFTGRYSIGHGVRNNGRYVLKDLEKTMAEYLQENGFNTYAVIASYILHSKFGINQGFKIYDDSLDTVKLDKTLKSEINAKSVYEKFDRWFEENYNSKFFAWVHFYDPHTPYIPHEDPTNKGKRDLIKLYDGELKYTDKYVGKIINRLEEADVADDTLIVIVGDHGEAFGEHTEYASHMVFCYEANLRVPMIFYNKKLIKSGVVIKKRVSTVDIMPTIFDILNIPKEDTIQGVSFENTLRGEELKSDRSVYIESMYGKEEMNWAPLTGIIDGDYKFISLPKPELYNIKKDPLEKENLYRKKGSLVREMDKELKNMILKLSGGGTDSKRELGKEDIEHLKSLGYFSSSGSKGVKNIDPKEGIVFTTKLKNISMKIDSDELDNLEKELLKMKESEIGSNNFLVFDYLYRLYLKKGNYSQAMDILKEAGNTLPNSIPFKTIYTMKLFDIKKYDEVIRNCFEIIKIDPLSTKAYLILSKTYYILGDNAKSDQYLLKAIDLEPKNISIRIKYSERLLEEKKFTEVLKVYDTLLTFVDVRNDVDLIYKIALFNTKYGSISKSGELLGEVIRKKPEGKYYYFYAMVLARLGDRANALKNMQIALSEYSAQLTTEQKATAERTIKAWK